MKIHSDLILFSVHENSAYVLFKGSEIKINFYLLDQRLPEFINFYQKNDISSDFPQRHGYADEELSELKQFFERSKFTTCKEYSFDENYLSYLSEDSSFNFDIIKNQIRWLSFFGEKINNKIASSFAYEKIDSLDSVNINHFCIIFCDSYDRDSLSSLASLLHKKKLHYLIVSIDYLKFSLGPIGTPFSRFCLECLLARKESNLTNSTYKDKFRGAAFAEKYDLPSFFISVICGFAQSEIIKFMTSDSSSLTSGVFEISLYQPAVSFSYLLPMPNCTVCT